MKLSIVIPCYNEARTIRQAVRSARRAALPEAIGEREVIVVDDASTDGAREIIQGELAKEIDAAVYHGKNRGKGAALRSGFSKASGDIVIVQDADLEYDAKEYPGLLEPIIQDKADVVYGSRFMGSSPHRAAYFWHMLGNRLLTLLTNIAANLNLTDMESGYKVFRRQVIESLMLREDRFGFEPEFTIKAARKGWRIYETGISYYGRTYAEGKKIKWKDGVRAVYCILKYGILR
ncbi:MAG: glycosyltransferase family 2 protein [Elusimicrobiota bacterium]